MGRKAKLTGAAALVATGFVAIFRELLIWLLGKLLDHVPHPTGAQVMTVAQSFPWISVAGLALVAVGVVTGIRAARQVTVVTQEAEISHLANRAGLIGSRIRDYRATRSFNRSRLPSILPIILDGGSTLLSFEKSGFVVPNFETREGERIAVAMEHFFTTIYPLLRDGHVEIARAQSASIAAASEQLCAAFKPSDWWQSYEY